MTDHANELRRHARKIPHPQGETPGVMLRAADEIECLHAKIEAMERQEPVGEIQRANSTGNYNNSVVWVPMVVGSKLYALPGAQPAPSVPDISDDMIEAIESRAEQSYRRRHSGIRGQQITPADALSWHIIHATRYVLAEAMEANRAP